MYLGISSKTQAQAYTCMSWGKGWSSETYLSQNVSNYLSFDLSFYLTVSRIDLCQNLRNVVQG